MYPFEITNQYFSFPLAIVIVYVIHVDYPWQHTRMNFMHTRKWNSGDPAYSHMPLWQYTYGTKV